jgi:hypothetical protein
MKRQIVTKYLRLKARKTITGIGRDSVGPFQPFIWLNPNSLYSEATVPTNLQTASVTTV